MDIWYARVEWLKWQVNEVGVKKIIAGGQKLEIVFNDNRRLVGEVTASGLVYKVIED